MRVPRRLTFENGVVIDCPPGTVARWRPSSGPVSKEPAWVVRTGDTSPQLGFFEGLPAHIEWDHITLPPHRPAPEKGKR